MAPDSTLKLMNALLASLGRRAGPVMLVVRPLAAVRYPMQMRHPVIIAVLVTMTSMAWLPQGLAQAASADLPSHAMKGYELYSW